MKIVIDIDNDTYNNIVKDFPDMLWSYSIKQSIKNGILQNPDCRLIDANDVLQRLNMYCDANCKYTECERDVMCRACPTGDAIEIVEDTPTIEGGVEHIMLSGADIIALSNDKPVDIWINGIIYKLCSDEYMEIKKKEEDE